MSVCTHTEEQRAELPVDRDRFTAQIFAEWAGDDRQKNRQLAAITLRSAGWTSRQIGLALGVSSSRARQLISDGRTALQQTFVPPSDRDRRADSDDGFSNPARDRG
jgi:hypothetical protein